ncbi:hypothetical protein G9A89_016221 [Geosiphon pyriformis]|nr:hypothetical protein G9A89_016221 [Geosiphon pyriformis]
MESLDNISQTPLSENQENLLKARSPPELVTSTPSKRSRAGLPSFKRLWTRKLSSSVNCLALGNVMTEKKSNLKKGALDIIVGTDTGQLLNINEDQEGFILETKGGPIQSMLIYDVTGFGCPDLIVGDSYGAISIFEREQLIGKRNISASVKHMAIFHDAVNGFEIVVGDSAGVLSAFTASYDIWRLKLTDETDILPREIREGMEENVALDPAIRCILCVSLLDSHQIETKYLLACDRSPFVHFLQGGIRRLSIPVPCVVNAMCSGYFSRKDNFDPEIFVSKNNTSAATQVALGGDDGQVYLLEDYTIVNLLKMDQPITNLKSFRPHDLDSTETDFLLCTGYFNEIRVYKDAELICSIITEDWVCCIMVGDVDGDGEAEFVIGMMNQVVEVYGCDSSDYMLE